MLNFDISKYQIYKELDFDIYKYYIKHKNSMIFCLYKDRISNTFYIVCNSKYINADFHRIYRFNDFSFFITVVGHTLIMNDTISNNFGTLSDFLTTYKF